MKLNKLAKVISIIASDILPGAAIGVSLASGIISALGNDAPTHEDGTPVTPEELAAAALAARAPWERIRARAGG